MATANSRKKSRMNTRCSVGILALGFTMLGATAARATTTFDLAFDAPDQIANYLSLNQGEVITYTGTITNTGSEDLYLNFANVDWIGGPPAWATYVVVDASVFQSAVAGPLASAPPAVPPANSWHGTLFTLVVSGVTLQPPGPDRLDGTFTVEMGNFANSSSAQVAPDFSLTVVPEPAGLALLGLGLLGLIRRPRKVLR